MQSPFVKSLEKLGVPLFMPMGSVGLTATLIALKLRSSENVKVCVTGLDFSFSVGVTHARGTHAHTAQLLKANKLCGVYNCASSFGNGSKSVVAKNGETVFTTKALLGYADRKSTRLNSSH